MDGAIIKRVGQLAFDIYYYGDRNFEDDRDLGRGPGDVGRISMTPEIMRQYLAAHAPELSESRSLDLPSSPAPRGSTVCKDM